MGILYSFGNWAVACKLGLNVKGVCFEIFGILENDCAKSFKISKSLWWVKDLKRKGMQIVH